MERLPGYDAYKTAASDQPELPQCRHCGADCEVFYRDMRSDHDLCIDCAWKVSAAVAEDGALAHMVEWCPGDGQHEPGCGCRDCDPDTYNEMRRGD